MSVLALLVFVAFWLKGIYGDKVSEVDTEVGLLWIKAIRTMERSKLTSMITIVSDEVKEQYGVDTVGEGNSISMLFSDATTSFISRHSRSVELQVSVIDDSSEAPTELLSSPNIPEEQRAFSKTIEEIMVDFSLDTAALAVVLDSLLAAEQLLVQCTIKELDEDPQGTQDPFYTFTATGNKYTLETDYPMGFIVQKMWFEGLLALLLLAMIAAAFYYSLYHLKQQHQLVTIKNDLISNITHELRTPIFTVSAALEALENFSGLDDPQKTKEYLDISQNELQRLSLLVEKVLKTALFEENAMTLTKEPLELNTLVKTISNSFKVQLEQESAQINLAPTLMPLTVHADKVHLSNVLYNLIDNALKYKSDSPTVIDIAIKDKGEQIQLSIADNGIGIPQAYQPQIFDKFFRVPTGNTHNVKGYGLGLNYVSKIIEQHRGTIQVNSQVGEGTEFVITLPKQ